MTLQTQTVDNESFRSIQNMIDPQGKLDRHQIELFMHVCQVRNLDPRLKQVYAVPRWNKHTGKNELTIQVSIDGFRLIADRTGRYAPGKDTLFTYDDKGKVVSATAFVKKRTADGTWHEVSATAQWSEYKPAKNDSFWLQMPHVMLGKCAEALALRKAFPGDLSGMYTEDEMEQADFEVIDSVEPQEESEENKKIDAETVAGIEKALEAHPDIKKKLLLMCNLKTIADMTVGQLEGSRTFYTALKNKKEKKNEIGTQAKHS